MDGCFAIIQELEKKGFDNYIPMYLSNGDLGGTFDPFGGTWYDELHSGGGRERDVRTLYKAGITAMDYWEKQTFSPESYRMTEESAQYIRESRAKGIGDVTSLVRGTPFYLKFSFPQDGFPEKAHSHRQTLDIKNAMLESFFNFGGVKFTVTNFIHALESVIVYRIEAGGSMKLEIGGMRGPESSVSGLNVFEFKSSVWCPSALAVYSSRGEWDGCSLLIPEGRTDIIIGYGHRKLGNPACEAIRVAQWAAGAGWERIVKSHVEWWKEKWDSFYIDIPDKEIEKIWYRSVYYVICSSSRRVMDGTSSECGLTGSFPSFTTGFFHLDAVFSMMAAPMLGLSELTEMSLNWIESVLPIAREHARSFYWLPGARYTFESKPGMLPYIHGHTRLGCSEYEHTVNGSIALLIHRYLTSKRWPMHEVKRWFPLIRDLAAFSAAMMTGRGDGWEIRFQPSHGVSESLLDLEDQPNIFDILATARYTIMLAADMMRRLGMNDAEINKWYEMQSKLRFDLLIKDDIYLHNEGYALSYLNGPYQVWGVLYPILQTLDRNILRTTIDAYYDRYKAIPRGHNTPSIALAYARLGDAQKALEILKLMLDPEYECMDAEKTIFFECSSKRIPGTIKGRTPYYMGATGLYAEAVCEMLLQDWQGDIQAFPACPWEEASFRLWAGGRCIEADKKGKEINYRIIG